jgi:hypothetical protein
VQIVTSTYVTKKVVWKEQIPIKQGELLAGKMHLELIKNGALDGTFFRHTMRPTGMKNNDLAYFKVSHQMNHSTVIHVLRSFYTMKTVLGTNNRNQWKIKPILVVHYQPENHCLISILRNRLNNQYMLHYPANYDGVIHCLWEAFMIDVLSPLMHLVDIWKVFFCLTNWMGYHIQYNDTRCQIFILYAIGGFLEPYN